MKEPSALFHFGKGITRIVRNPLLPYHIWKGSSDPYEMRSFLIECSTDETKPAIKPQKKYAMVLVDHYHGIFRKNVLKEPFTNTGQYVIDTLKQCNYDEIVLVSHDKNLELANKIHRVEPTLENLVNAFEHMGDKATPNDQFFFYTLNHSGPISFLRPNKGARINIYDDTLTDEDLHAMLKPFDPVQSILYFNGCFSGLLGKAFGKGNHTAISTSKPDKMTYASHAHVKDVGYIPFGTEFTKEFFAGAREKRKSVIDLFIAAGYAQSRNPPHDDYNQTPMLFTADVDLKSLYL